jgi:hypothetical protein
MAITAHRYRRIEIWSNWQAAGGTRQFVIADATGLTCVSNVQGLDKLTLTLPTNSQAATFLNSGSVIRIDQDDTPTFDEWKIVEGPDDDDITGMRSCVAAPFRTSDLASCDIVRRIDSDGTNVPDFESVGLTPALHISTWILPACARAGLSFVVAGTITPTGNYDMTYAWDSPLSALTRLAEITQMELDIRRVGTTQYAIDLVPSIGSTAPVADVRLGRNLVNLRRTRVATEQATRVFPRGMQIDNAYATMARAMWKVVSTAGPTITLTDPAGGAGPIQFSGQLARGGRLYGYWPFDVDASDKSGNANNGVLQNGASIVPGIFGNAVSLDGLNDYVEVPHTATLSYTGGALTMAAWINPGLTEANGYIFSKPWNGSGQYNWQLAYGSGVVSVLLFGTTGWNSGGIAFPNDGKWHHIAVTIDASKNVLVYADGVLIWSGVHTITAWVPSGGVASLPLAIGTLYPYGSGWAGDATQAFLGLIDDARVYTTTLSAQDIVRLVQQPLLPVFFREPDGTSRQVIASDAVAQTVTLDSSPAGELGVGDLVNFREGVSGADLLYLDSPADMAAYGLKAASFDVPDVPATNNLLKNPVMRAWPGSSAAPPTSWTALGAPTIAKQTVGPYTAIGGNAIHVTATTDGQGVISDAVSLVGLSALNPYISGFARVWGVSGQFRVELVFTTPSGTTTLPVLPDVADNTVNGQFSDIGLTGIDANAIGATAVQLRVVQHGTVAAEFYVDAAQVSRSPAQLPFVEGSGGTRLWQAANDRLRQNGAPLVSYEVPIVDLAAVNPGLWAADTQLAVGGQVRVADARLGLTILTRLMELQRDYKTPGATKIVLSNRPDDITGTLARPPRPARNDITDSTLNTGPQKPTITYIPDAAGNVNVSVALSNRTTAVRAVANKNGTMPSAAQVNAATGQAVNLGAVSFNFGNLLTGLVTGDRYNIAIRAYDAAGVASDVETLSDVYISGVLGATPGVAMGTPAPSSTSITFPITPNLHTTNFEIYVKEYDSDPGALVDVDAAYATPYDDVVVGASPARAQAGNVFNLTIPVGASSNYLMVTIVPYNAYIVGTKGRAKSQGSGTPPPSPPTARANVSHTPTSVTNSVTMPATAPGFIRVYRDNVFIQDVAVSVGGGATQTLPADTGLTPSTAYSYTYSSVTSGVESTTRTSPLVVTTDAPGGGGGTLPTPSLSGYYDTVEIGAFEFTITPGDGTTGVTWHIERSTTTSGGTYTEILSGASLTPEYVSTMDGAAHTWYFKVWGTKTGHTDSPRSAFVAIVKPKIGS